MMRFTSSTLRAATKSAVRTTAPKKAVKAVAPTMMPGFSAQQDKMASLLNETFETTPIDDVGERAFGEATATHKETNMLPILPESADPMVALVAASVDMQYRQTEQMEQAAHMQQDQHQRTIAAMQNALDGAKIVQSKHLDNLRKALNDRRSDEVETLRTFGDQQRKYLKNTLQTHTDAEKKRLDNFRRTSEGAATRKLKSQEDKFTKSVSQVSATLTQHASGLQRLLNGLRSQQDVTKNLTATVERKAAAAMSAKKASTNATVTAIQAVEASLKKEQERGAAAVISAVGSRNKKQVEAVQRTLKAHNGTQKKQLITSFKSHQDSQIKGLASAVAHQKQTQSQQLSDLREALAARRRVAFGGANGTAGQLPSPMLGASASNNEH